MALVFDELKVKEDNKHSRELRLAYSGELIGFVNITESDINPLSKLV